MSIITIKKNITSNEWTNTELIDDNNYYHIDVHFGFFDNNSNNIEFNTLKFGAELYSENNLLQSKTYPPENVNMFKTQSEYLQVIRFSCQPSTSYKIKIWCNNSAIYAEKYLDILTPSIPDYESQFRLYHDGRSSTDPIDNI